MRKPRATNERLCQVINEVMTMLTSDYGDLSSDELMFVVKMVEHAMCRAVEQEEFETEDA